MEETSISIYILKKEEQARGIVALGESPHRKWVVMSFPRDFDDENKKSFIFSAESFLEPIMTLDKTKNFIGQIFSDYQLSYLEISERKKSKIIPNILSRLNELWLSEGLRSEQACIETRILQKPKKLMVKT